MLLLLPAAERWILSGCKKRRRDTTTTPLPAPTTTATTVKNRTARAWRMVCELRQQEMRGACARRAMLRIVINLIHLVTFALSDHHERTERTSVGGDGGGSNGGRPAHRNAMPQRHLGKGGAPRIVDQVVGKYQRRATITFLRLFRHNEHVRRCAYIQNRIPFKYVHTNIGVPSV